jgi:hypothetical protein
MTALYDAVRVPQLQTSPSLLHQLDTAYSTVRYATPAKAL